MSIADVLCEAVDDVDSYLRAGTDHYGNNVNMWIMAVRDSMEVLRCRLDVDPAGREPLFRPYSDQPEPTS